ncbi:MAG: ATP-binding protein [Marinilabiliales bacterium]|nr:ATP-binding protein [Marinilabiliales bacterium]
MTGRSFHSSRVRASGSHLGRELAELHRAELKAESEEGKGATFRVIFRLGFAHFDNETEFVLADGQSSPSSRHAETGDE